MTPATLSVTLSRADLASGTMDDVTLADGAITLAGGAPAGSWTGAWETPGFDVERVIPSWNADTPAGSHLTVEIQGQTRIGYETGWYEVAHWALDDSAFRRTSVEGQANELGRIETDVFHAVAPLESYRLRLTLHRGGEPPTVRMVSAVASAGEPAAGGSSPLATSGVELAVPPYSQVTHTGDDPEYGRGRSSRCSPASTAMVVSYWGTGPSSEELSSIDPARSDPRVDHAARHVYDVAHGGFANWSFNTAYAATFGLEAFVTRLRSLREAEQLLRAGIPVVASLEAVPGELDGHPQPQGTADHVVVVTGVTRDGHPIVNDPAAPSDDEVRRVYDRGQFERAWLGGSGGVVSVIRDPARPLPPSAGNW